MSFFGASLNSAFWQSVAHTGPTILTLFAKSPPFSQTFMPMSHWTLYFGKEREARCLRNTHPLRVHFWIVSCLPWLASSWRQHWASFTVSFLLSHSEGLSGNDSHSCVCLFSMSFGNLLCRFLCMYLFDKPETEHTGQESYILENLWERKLDFFPVGKAFRLKSEDHPLPAQPSAPASSVAAPALTGAPSPLKSLAPGTSIHVGWYQRDFSSLEFILDATFCLAQSCLSMHWRLIGCVLLFWGSLSCSGSIMCAFASSYVIAVCGEAELQNTSACILYCSPLWMHSTVALIWVFACLSYVIVMMDLPLPCTLYSVHFPCSFGGGICM